MDKFHFTPLQIGQLTRVQIETLCLHERDAKGNLKPPLMAASQVIRKTSKETRLADLDRLKALAKRMGKELKGYAERRAKIMAEPD